MDEKREGKGRERPLHGKVADEGASMVFWVGRQMPQLQQNSNRNWKKVSSPRPGWLPTTANIPSPPFMFRAVAKVYRGQMDGNVKRSLPHLFSFSFEMPLSPRLMRLCRDRPRRFFLELSLFPQLVFLLKPDSPLRPSPP